jgi:hypothetical protein
MKELQEDVVFSQQMNIAKAFSEMMGIPIEDAAAIALDVIEERTGLDCSHWKRTLAAYAAVQRRWTRCAN